RRRLTSGAILGRRSRVVLAPQCLGAKLATMLAHRADDGCKRDGSPGRARISRKPLRREGRSVSACTCGLRALAHLSCAGAPGAAATRPSLLPPIFKGGQRRCKTRAKGAARICSLARRPPAGLIAPLALETRVERCWLQSWATWGPARC